jgi:uncharacterized membrane protein
LFLKYTHMRRGAGLLIVAALAYFNGGTPAFAEFAVCNQTLDIANVAIAESSSGALKSSGWWVIAPNRCANVVEGVLKSRYVYIHAVDGRGRALLDGKAEFCTDLKQFAIEGQEKCWLRGFTSANFTEIDTKDAQSWTLFLGEPPNG